MALEMDDIVNMSLDDYIAKTASSNSGSISRSSSDSSKKSTFKARRRKNHGVDNDNEEEEEEEGYAFLDTEENVEEVSRSDVEAASDSYGIWRGPSLNTSYIDLNHMEDDSDLNLAKEELQLQKTQQSVKEVGNARDTSFDLRNKINNNAQMPHRNSQQWRLMRPNNVAQRPAGMPPLVPKDTLPPNNNKHWRRRRNRNRWGQTGMAPNGCCGGGGGGGFNRFNNRWEETNGLGCFNNGLIQQNNQRNNQDMLNKHLSAVVERLNSGCNNNSADGGACNMTIEVPTAVINLSSDPLRNRTAANNQQQTQHAIDVGALTSANGSANNNLRALLGIKDNFTREEMPMLASRFLDFLKNGPQATMHKPLYDMKIQKDIHEIQKKALIYKCPGGEVVSSDGAGINNCQIIPRTSGVSMNYRFA